MTWIDLLALTAIGQTREHPLVLVYEVRDLMPEVRALAAADDFYVMVGEDRHNVPDHLIEKAAVVLFRSYDSQYDGACVKDFHDEAREVLEAVAGELRAEGAPACECCGEQTTRPYVHPVEGIDLCAPCAVSLMEPTVEEARAEGARAERERIAREIEAMGKPTATISAFIAARVREGGDTA